MITVQQARKLSDDNSKLDEIEREAFKQIEEAAKQGKYSVHLKIPIIVGGQYESLVRRMHEQGFKTGYKLSSAPGIRSGICVEW